MNTPTVTIYFLPLYASLPFLLFSYQYDLIALSLFSTLTLVCGSGFLSFSLLFCPWVTSFCIGLWQCPAMAVLLRGTTDMHELLHCYELNNGSSLSKCLACAYSASPATWQCCERMLHQYCGQDYLKNLLKLNLHFYNFCSFCTSYWRFI